MIVSPRVHVDTLWQVWKDFVKAHYDWADEDTMFDHYGEGALREIIETHNRATMDVERRHKGNMARKLFSLCVLFDDLIDDNKFHDSHGCIVEIC